MLRFTDKVCVVNGVASEIGEAVARRFAAEGGTVVGVDVREHTSGDLSLLADLTDEAQVEEMYGAVIGAYGRLDVVYNNIGLMDFGDLSLMNTEVDTWRRVQDGNLTTTFLACKHGVPHLLNAGGGSIVNASSFLGEIGAATAQMGFAAAKAAVVQLTRDLGVHLARSGVRVNAVLFGPIETAAQRAIFGGNPAALEKRMIHWPMGRFGTLEEAAATVAFLASDDAGFITAAAIPLDGGINQAFTVPE